VVLAVFIANWPSAAAEESNVADAFPFKKHEGREGEL
jgi:hypothetical protein